MWQDKQASKLFDIMTTAAQREKNKKDKLGLNCAKLRIVELKIKDNKILKFLKFH